LTLVVLGEVSLNRGLGVGQGMKDAAFETGGG
jgi:hypothetical protein